MSADFLSKLSSRYFKHSSVTPNQITHSQNGNSAEAESRDPLDTLIFGLRDSLGPVLDSDRKLNKFRGRLSRLIASHKYTASELSMLDISCIHQDGRINDEEFLWLLKEKGIRE